MDTIYPMVYFYRSISPMKAYNNDSQNYWRKCGSCKKEIGFNSDFNKVSMIDQKGNIRILPKNKKSFIANKIAEILLDKLLIDDKNIN